MKYTHMVIRKINGRVVSRHATHENAIKATRKWAQPERDPVEVREYSEKYYQDMK